MKENKYDDMSFFEKYSQMPRSLKGLDGAGEWNTLKAMLPNLKGKRVLDLGCGFGWHCVYAVEHGAKSITGIDISKKMLEKAREMSGSCPIEYLCVPIEDYEYSKNSFDVVISSLAFHYVKSFDDVCAKVSRCLTDGGHFIFSVEHPVFTAEGSQKWICDISGNLLHWPVDRYFDESDRTAFFLEEEVIKYHRTLTAYINSLLSCDFEITGFCEPMPPTDMLYIPDMKDELRRPMMLIVSAAKRRETRKNADCCTAS